MEMCYPWGVGNASFGTISQKFESYGGENLTSKDFEIG